MTGVGSLKLSRGQSEVLGYLLVFVMVLVGATIVLALGLSSIGDSENQLTLDRAEKTLTQLDAKAGTVELGGGSQRISLPVDAGEQYRLDESAGWINVSARNHTSGETFTITNTTMGAIVYENGGREIAYQGGGVWRSQADEGLMVSPPELHYRDATVTLPALRISGDGQLGGAVLVEHVSTTQKFPDGNRSNPLEHHVVTVTVQSEYYLGWAQYLSQRTDGTVDIDNERNRVSSSLVSPIGDVEITAAVQGHSRNGDLVFQSDPSHPCSGESQPPYFDRYDSRLPGGYCDQYDPSTVSRAGSLTFGGDITSQAAAGQIQANLVTGGTADLFQNQDLHGNVTYVETCQNCEAAQSGAEGSHPQAVPDGGYWTKQVSTVETAGAIDLTVDQTVREFRNNVDERTITGGDTLEAGNYYTRSIDLDGESVVFDTTEGDINIAVEETVHLVAGATVDVVGGGSVSMYVRGSGGADDLRIQNSELYVPDNRATGMAVLGGRDFDATIEDGEYTGVIYAPAGEGGDGNVEIFRGGNVYGGIVTGDMLIGSPGGGTVHHDAALAGHEIVSPDVDIVRVTYLHVSENHVRFTDI